MKKCLIYGFGNPGRQDDGLGISLAEWTAETFPEIDVETNYQLNIEDSHTIREYDYVIFADASIKPIEGITVNKVEPTFQTEFTMHAMDPGFILHLCQTLYHKYPEVFLISMKGYEFEFGADMSLKAASNLETAKGLIKDLLKVKGKLNTSILCEAN